MKEIRLFIKREPILLFMLLIFLINPMFKGYYMCYILALYFLTLRLNFFITSIDIKGILLFFFSVSYSIIYSFTVSGATIESGGGKIFISLYAISPITFYIIGKYFSTTYPSYKVYYFLFLFLALGYSFIPAISIIKHIIEGGFMGERKLSLLWNNQEVINGTVLGAFFTLNIATLGTLFVQKTIGYENKIKFISFVAFIISLLCVLRVASRTQLGIALISLLVTIFYLMFKQSLKRNIFLILSTTILIFVIFYMISINSVYFNMLNARNNDAEELLSATGRTGLWLTALGNLTKYPFGWVKSTPYPAHNLWLDVARVGGIIPFIFLCIFTISSIFLIIKTLKISPSNHYFNNTILVLFVGFMTVFFVEPIIEGMYLLFLIFCFYTGILSGYVKN